MQLSSGRACGGSPDWPTTNNNYMDGEEQQQLHQTPRQHPTIDNEAAIITAPAPASAFTSYYSSSSLGNENITHNIFTAQRNSTLPSITTSAHEQDHLSASPASIARTSRRPSPGLAARLRALGFGSHSNRRQKSDAHLTDSIGRIPSQKIEHLDQLARANSVKPIVQRRGRAWSGASGRLPPVIVGDSSTGFRVSDECRDSIESQSDLASFLDWDIREPDIRSKRISEGSITEETAMIATHHDPHKYRLPDHINGNGTKAMPDIRKAHLEREVNRDDDDAPPPISKDSPVESNTPNDFSGQVQEYFNPFGLQRAGSIYTLSRVSFANQLAQLTSLQLPDAKSLSSRVSAIPTSRGATTALMSAAEQIRSWIAKASDVLGGLDADDDVEWAAAGGREGLEEVDNAINRFEELVNVYVSAIEQLHNREDIGSVPGYELQRVVTQVEGILMEWEKIRRTLNGVKSQVEIAMEWEELWNVVLGDIGSEMDTLSRLVFEMEERRHKSLIDESGDVNIGELETIVEDTPPSKTLLQANSRFSISAGFPMSPSSPNTPTMAQDDSSLLALYARMQPLRASLDFLPMRLSTFHTRADTTFPTACEELETRKMGLEKSWGNLEKDAESLRRELGEDRWVLVFRGAGRQAQKMYESVDRSLQKLKEAIETGGHLNNPGGMSKKIESFESKKMHYGPAIERVLAIIEKGVQDRLTVNGEIVRLHTDMQKKWNDMKAHMNEIDLQLDELQADKRNQQLRDSVSSLMSNDRSTVGSLNDTPGSSPASSVIMSGLEPSTPARLSKLRPSHSHLPQPSSRRGVTPNSSSLPRKAISRISSYGFPSTNNSPSPASRSGSSTPLGSRISRPSAGSADGKPRWSSGFVKQTNEDPLGLTLNKLQLTTPSPYAKPSGPPLSHKNSSLSLSSPLQNRESKLPLKSPLGTEHRNSSPLAAALSSTVDDTPTKAKAPAARSNSRLGYATKITTPGPYSQQALTSSTTGKPRALQNQAITTNLASRRISLQPSSFSQSAQGNSGGAALSRPSLAARPASSLASSRRTSLLPTARGRQGSAVNGRESPQAVSAARAASRQAKIREESTDSRGGAKPQWRG